MPGLGSLPAAAGVSDSSSTPTLWQAGYSAPVTFARSERQALCDALEGAGPDAPTLCEGWTAHDLAAHLWLRENDPLATPGLVIKAFADQADARMAEVKQRMPFLDLVRAIRTGPVGLSVFRLPGVDEAANAAEFFVHCEDVRRGAGAAEPRDLDPDFEDWAWKRLRLIGRALFRRSRVAVVLEREGPSGQPATHRVAPGPDIVTVVGRPSELMLYAFGRRSAARVSVIGQPATVAVLERVDLSV